MHRGHSIPTIPWFDRKRSFGAAAAACRYLSLIHTRPRVAGHWRHRSAHVRGSIIQRAQRRMSDASNRPSKTLHTAFVAANITNALLTAGSLSTEEWWAARAGGGGPLVRVVFATLPLQPVVSEHPDGSWAFLLESPRGGRATSAELAARPDFPAYDTGDDE
ncbi:hypothetical protein C8Q80DRAFT_1351454 [Daedaleopsis nitida]|nr:hypothetical protein C8Q80DRAFT_1351454 [Daedaleopsis nitida]